MKKVRYFLEMFEFVSIASNRKRYIDSIPVDGRTFCTYVRARAPSSAHCIMCRFIWECARLCVRVCYSCAFVCVSMDVNACVIHNIIYESNNSNSKKNIESVVYG